LSVPVAEYKRLLTEAYDLDKPEAPAGELERWLRYARAARGPVLEVMCGSGRFLVPLAVAGIDIDGIDASVDMLAACKKRCDEQGVSPGLHRQFAQELDLPRRYSLAFIAAGSFGLIIDDADCRAALHQLFEHLEPGAVLVVDAETPAVAPRRTGRWFGRWWNRPDGATIVLRELGRYDPETRIEEGLGIYELFVDGRLVETELNNWVRRFWTAEELEIELSSAGFVDIEITEPYEGALLAEAHRPG
jgi:SAM-dependent methyltransferase